jgi:release factor glutamine methyltransferase
MPSYKHSSTPTPRRNSVATVDDMPSLLRAATTRLEAAGVDSPRWDAEQLVAFVADVPRSQLAQINTLAPEQTARFHELVERRAARVPLQHLTGSVGFRYIDLEVGAGVFVPRPETELVAGIAIDRARELSDAPVVVDVCSGSGAIALAVANEIPTAQVHAVEIDPDALRWLVRNATGRREAGDQGVGVHQDDVVDALPELDGLVDVVVANPPYVAADELAEVDPEVRDHDPRIALVAGDDGLAVIHQVAATARRLLRPGGWLVVEHSDRQGESAPAALIAAGFVDVTEVNDLAGRPRVASGRSRP